MERFANNIKTWEPPLELQRSTPREVELSGQGKAMVVLMIVFVTTAIAGSVILASRASADEKRWAEWKSEAVTTRGEVTGLRKRGSGDDTKHYVDYSYRVDQTNYSATEKVRSREWKLMHQGDTLDVVYRRSYPGQSWLPNHEPTGVPSYAALLVGIGFLIPVPIVAYQVRRQRRLLEEGHATLATVVNKKKFSSQHGKHYRIEYEFQTWDGARRSGRYQAHRTAPEVGDQLIVVYHPDEDHWSAKYPMSLVRVVNNE